MYLKLNEELIKKIDKRTIGDYEIKGDLIPSEYIEDLISDLIVVIDELEEQLEAKDEEEFEECEIYGVDKGVFY